MTRHRIVCVTYEVAEKAPTHSHVTKVGTDEPGGIKIWTSDEVRNELGRHGFFIQEPHVPPGREARVAFINFASCKTCRQMVLHTTDIYLGFDLPDFPSCTE
jgi:hypothetical protein